MARDNDDRPVVGQGQLLKALTQLPNCTDQRFRIAAVYLAHTRPPDLVSYPKPATVAKLAGDCTKRSTELCRRWLEDVGAVTIERGGGRGRHSTIDFTPLAERINSERAHAVSGVASNKTAKAGARKSEGRSGKQRSGEHRHLIGRTHLKNPSKGSAAAPPSGGGRAALPAENWPECVEQLELDFSAQDFNMWIRPLQAVHEDALLTLFAPNRYVVDWVRQHCLDRIAEWWRAQGNDDGRVAVEVGSRNAREATA